MSDVSTVTWPAEGRISGEPYHLSDEEVRFFDDNGYLVLRDRVPQPLLSRLQAATADLIAIGEAAPPGNDPADYRYADRPTGRTMFRVDYLHDKGEDSTLELLGSPAILGIAETLLGRNFVPTYESLVFKQEGDGAPIEWHQDALHPRNGRIFNVDIYLDDSRTGEGALRVVPGSQRSTPDICELQTDHGWEPPGVISVEMGPGDVLVHDVMLLHGSEAVTGNRLRRTIYYEFRAAEQILTEGPWDAEWVAKRLALLPAGLAAYARANPDETGFRWGISDEYRPDEVDDRSIALKVAHMVGSPGNYCSAGSVPPRSET
jgi:ectoine hydroxylase-related dioxygenase (phytanoyl-CoA dioxygenase family)